MQPDKRLITPLEAYTTFKKMSDSDLILLGLSEEYARPEWTILAVLPVPPPPVRPSIAVEGDAMRSEVDLTYKLGDVVRASANVRRCEREGAPARVITEFEQLLQERIIRCLCFILIRGSHVATYMDNCSCWNTLGSAEVWSSRDGYLRSTKGGAVGRGLGGQASEFLGSDGHRR